MTRETVKLNHLHIAPRKARLVANLIKGMPANEAEAQLMFRPKRSAGPILKLLRSGIANMVNNRKLDRETLVVESVMVDCGPTMKRFLPRAQGRATPLLKRTCHVTLVLKDSKNKSARFNTAKPKSEKEAKKMAQAAKKHEHKPKEAGHKEAAATSENKQGFVKQFFRRKSV